MGRKRHPTLRGMRTHARTFASRSQPAVGAFRTLPCPATTTRGPAQDSCHDSLSLLPDLAEIASSMVARGFESRVELQRTADEEQLMVLHFWRTAAP